MVYTILLTGGCGHLGSHILEELCCISKGIPFITAKAPTIYDQLDAQLNATQQEMLSEKLSGCVVKVFDIRDEITNYDGLDGLLEDVDFIQGDLRSQDDVDQAVEGCDAVIHVGCVVDFGNVPSDLIKGVNVDGTRHIVSACKKYNVQSLVFCSTLDVVIVAGGCEGWDENAPQAVKSGVPFNLDRYMLSKSQAEDIVMTSGLNIGVIRCVGMYGERDPFHIESVLKQGKEGGTRVMIGDGSGVFQHAYTGNVAHMHVCLLNKMLSEEYKRVKNPIYMGIDYTKVNNFFDFMVPYLVAFGYPTPDIRLPKGAILALAHVVSGLKFHVLDKLSATMRKTVITLTPQAVHGVTVDQWFHTDKAERELGYAPLVCPMRARELTIRHFQTKKQFRKKGTKAPKREFATVPDPPTSIEELEAELVAKHNDSNGHRGVYYDSGVDYKPDNAFRKSRKDSMKQSLYVVYSVIAVTVGLVLAAGVLRK